ncbi:murein hydrolase activator EnvC family protein [Mesoterricola sediminis]|uniref:Peptidase M23 n=1 Tax=Mesoterricola sediminis TaxID=2927980 RepID=A0AA48GVL1_9BACT|nr:peptidoglycan DD-metalloendopeptidase family protein [Mesoterricola sediminis]BDU75210.1 peptidase M23 [Mesoterricola sediminis]
MRKPLLLLALTVLPAQEPLPAPQDLGQVKERLAGIQSALKAVDQQMEALKKRRKGVLVELQGISLQADRVRAQAEQARLKRDQARLEVAAITQRKEETAREIQQRREELRREVRWMQALGPLGDLGLATAFGSFEQYLSQGRYVAYLRNQQRRRLDRIQRLQTDLARREAEIQEAVARLAREEEEAHRLQASLKLNEERLEGFLDGLKQDESRQKSVQAELAEEALQLERMLNQLLSKPRPDAFEPGLAFAGLRGELPQPTPGTLAQAFGEHLHPKFHTRTMQSGLLIAATAGAPVAAVADGKVVFADIYQSFGPMVILDHGGGWFSLYTHLRGVGAAKGQVLKQGEPVGTVGVTVDGPRLGFEIRHLTQPQDPNKWLKTRYR